MDDVCEVNKSTIETQKVEGSVQYEFNPIRTPEKNVRGDDIKREIASDISDITAMGHTETIILHRLLSTTGSLNKIAPISTHTPCQSNPLIFISPSEDKLEETNEKDIDKLLNISIKTDQVIEPEVTVWDVDNVIGIAELESKPTLFCKKPRGIILGIKDAIKTGLAQTECREQIQDDISRTRELLGDSSISKNIPPPSNQRKTSLMYRKIIKNGQSYGGGSSSD